MGLGKDAKYYLSSYQEFCSQCCDHCETVPSKNCPRYCLILQKGALIPFEKIQAAYTQYKGDLRKVCAYIKRYRLRLDS